MMPLSNVQRKYLVKVYQTIYTHIDEHDKRVAPEFIIGEVTLRQILNNHRYSKSQRKYLNVEIRRLVTLIKTKWIDE